MSWRRVLDTPDKTICYMNHPEQLYDLESNENV